MQLLGGIGFTWEHDAHLHLKRALADRQLLGETDRYLTEVAAVAGWGARRSLTADLPEEAERARAELAPVIAELGASKASDRRRHWSMRGWSCRTGRARGVGTPTPSSRW